MQIDAPTGKPYEKISNPAPASKVELKENQLKSSRTKLTAAVSLTQLSKAESLQQVNITESDKTPRQGADGVTAQSAIEAVATTQGDKPLTVFENAFCCTLFCIEERFADLSPEFITV